MFAGHNPYLVVLSVAVAILGGYTGFGIATRLRGTQSINRRKLLAWAAGFLAIGIWTMHFIGMLAAPIPDGATYLVLPTIISFLICALVVGISLFFVSIGEPSEVRVTASALLLGVGIVSMHYVGMHGLAGDFHIEHKPAIIWLASLVAVGTAYGGLKIFLAQHVGSRLALSAVAFGVAVSGMHYTAMYGMRFRSVTGLPHHSADGLSASPQALALIVSLLCFLIIAGFLLFLVPETRTHIRPALPEAAVARMFGPTLAAEEVDIVPGAISIKGQRPLPLAGLGQPRPGPALRIPVEGADGVHFVETADVRSINADAHYTMVHDGTRERMSPWSISEAESHLDPAFFLRVHRSHIIAISHVAFVRKEGEGAVVELDGSAPHLVPVSRAKSAELRARLGLTRRRAQQS
ncbi:MHYT domain-containing protein [Phyllobacterium sp. SB3]|uniref:MHYT domain-containing protein n=1 Tax=Phyllobacterium sp. SB3 TaxID=3156073 RepID=UPI0032AFF282